MRDSVMYDDIFGNVEMQIRILPTLMRLLELRPLGHCSIQVAPNLYQVYLDGPGAVRLTLVLSPIRRAPRAEEQCVPIRLPPARACCAAHSVHTGLLSIGVGTSISDLQNVAIKKKGKENIKFIFFLL